MTADPNVVPDTAAAFLRSLVFERRESPTLDPREILDRLEDGGFGADLPAAVRRRRMRAWVLQVLRRLRKYRWIEGAAVRGWAPAPPLKECEGPGALERRVPRRSRGRSAAGRDRGTAVWTAFVQDWVFAHRRTGFQVGEIAAAMVQRGFGGGGLDRRLDAAFRLAEEVLGSLEVEGLLGYVPGTETWEPTELLRGWPAAE